MTNTERLQASSDQIGNKTSGLHSQFGRIILLALLIGGGIGIGLQLYQLLNGLLTGDSSDAFELFHSRLESRRVGEFSYSEIQALQSASSVFARVSAYSPVPVVVSNGTWQQNVDGSFVTGGYLQTLGSRIAVGNDFSCDGHDAGNPCLQAILSSELWRDRFASDPNVIGRAVTIDGRAFRVQGVLAPGAVRVDVGRDPQLWIPLETEPVLLGVDWTSETSTVHWLLPVVRLTSGITLDRAENAVASMFHRQGEFMLVSPGQANLARAFRIRGGVVELFGRHLRGAFWTGIFLWALGLNWLMVFVVGYRIRWFDVLILAFAETAIAFVMGLIAKRVLNASLYLFGTPNLARQHQLNWQTFGGIALALVCAGLVIYLATIASRRQGADAAPATRILSAGWLKSVGDHRYLVLSALLLVLITGYTANGLCVSDFWEHAAVVRELAAHPVHPPNPILPVNAPHAGYSPYALALGYFSRITGLSAVDTLRFAGILNVLLFVCTFGLFVRAGFPAKHTDFYALLFALVLWGFFPWYMSGFLHLNVLGIVAGYPSTFATGMLFLAWYLSILVAKSRSPWLLLPLTVVVAGVCLDHPLTAISMFVGLFALTFDFGRSWSSMLRLAAVCAAAVLLACLWPYYDIRALLLSRTGHFDVATKGMYPGFVATIVLIFPAFVGLPLLLRRFRSNWRDFVCLIFLCLSFVYAFGWFSGKFTLGRVMPLIVLMLQLAAADWLARYQENTAIGAAPVRARWTRNLVLAATALGAIMMLPGFFSSIPVFQNSYGEYRFLSRYLSDRDTVLSDFETDLRLPAFGPKVVAYHPDHILFFVGSEQRENDDQRFFSEATGDAERKRILEKYGEPFVLLNKYKTDAWPNILRSVGKSSPVVYSDGDMLLLKTSN